METEKVVDDYFVGTIGETYEQKKFVNLFCVKLYKNNQIGIML